MDIVTGGGGSFPWIIPHLGIYLWSLYGTQAIFQIADMLYPQLTYNIATLKHQMTSL